MARCSLADGRRRRVCWLAGALAGGVISTRGVGRSTRIQRPGDWLDGAGRKDMTLKLCLGAKLSCRLGEEPYPRAPDGLMPGRRTAGSREAGGGADCHAGLENAFVPAGGRRESRGSRADGPEEQVQGQGRVLPALAVRNGTLGKPRLRADGFSQLKLVKKRKSFTATATAIRVGGSKLFMFDSWSLLLPSSFDSSLNAPHSTDTNPT
jgi:hypothetical protein